MFLGYLVEKSTFNLPQFDHVMFELSILFQKGFIDLVQFGHYRSVEVLNDVFEMLPKVIEIPTHSSLLFLYFPFEVAQISFLFTKQKQHLLTVQLILG